MPSIMSSIQHFRGDQSQEKNARKENIQKKIGKKGKKPLLFTD